MDRAVSLHLKCGKPLREVSRGKAWQCLCVGKITVGLCRESSCAGL